MGAPHRFSHLHYPGGKTMAFGQHQTFYLRQQWLTKGLLEAQKDSRFFYHKDHFEILGVGKNMAKSIRYWLLATQLVEEKRSTQTEVVLSDLGNIVYEKDLYTKQPFTIGLLHYLLVTEKDIATAWYWFFNIFNERVFTKEILLEQLTKWVSETQEKEVSANSLKRDVDCLLALYTAKVYENQTPEDVIRSPFEMLGLTKKHEGAEIVYMKKSLQSSATFDILYTTLVKYFNKHQVTEVSLTDLVSAPELWGKVFNMSRDQIIDCLDEMKKVYGITFTQTNHLDIVRIEDQNWLDVVKEIYTENEVLG